MAYYDENSNELMTVIIDYCCPAYQTDYNGLADLIGCNRGWFTRYRNAEFGKKGVNTTFKLIELATNVDRKQLCKALFNE